MKRIVLAAALLGAVVCLQGPSDAHGGTYRGPGDTVPPGGNPGAGGAGGGVGGPSGPSNGNPNGPYTPGVGGPGVPGQGAGTGSFTPGSDGGASDFTQWSFWWEFNKEPYLRLKAHVRKLGLVSGSDEWFLGNKSKVDGNDSLAPTEQQVREQIVPALIEALEKETNNDIVTGCMIALAKIGDAPSESGQSRFEEIFKRFLTDKNQEVRETAAVALGILADSRLLRTLELLLLDDPEGRKLVAQPEVDYRTRSFAAYGLGLIGARTGSDDDRQRIVEILRKTLESESTRTRDLKVSCVIALGLVPVEGSRAQLIDFLLSFLRDERQEQLVRAHCPAALVRLLPGLPADALAVYRQKIAEDLLERISPGRKEKVEVVQSAVLALGSLGTNDGADPLDRKIRAALAAAPRELSDQQARFFALISLAKVGGTTSPLASDPQAGIDEASKALLAQLADGKAPTKAWAGLACGVLGAKLADTQLVSPRTAVLEQAVRTTLDEERDPQRVGALAISAGIMGDIEAMPILVGRLQSEKDETARGYVAVGLGLMNAQDAKGVIQKVVDDSRYRPELLKQAAIALGLLGDKDAVPKLIALLQESKGLATQASLSSALGFIGDRRSVEPLLVMLRNQGLTERARAFAAVALGIVADKESLPWNSKIALDLNYRAATQTLTDQAGGTGILDIL